MKAEDFTEGSNYRIIFQATTGTIYTFEGEYYGDFKNRAEFILRTPCTVWSLRGRSKSSDLSFRVGELMSVPLNSIQTCEHLDVITDCDRLKILRKQLYLVS